MDATSRQMSRSVLMGSGRGGRVQRKLKGFEVDHPVCAALVASRHFFWRSHPSSRGGEYDLPGERTKIQTVRTVSNGRRYGPRRTSSPHRTARLAHRYL